MEGIDALMKDVVLSGIGDAKNSSGIVQYLDTIRPTIESLEELEKMINLENGLLQHLNTKQYKTYGQRLSVQDVYQKSADTKTPVQYCG